MPNSKVLYDAKNENELERQATSNAATFLKNVFEKLIFGKCQTNLVIPHLAAFNRLPCNEAKEMLKQWSTHPEVRSETIHLQVYRPFHLSPEYVNPNLFFKGRNLTPEETIAVIEEFEARAKI